MLIAIEEYKLGNIELGKLVTGAEGLNLLFNSLFKSDIIIGLSLNASDIIPLTITGFISIMIDDLFNGVIGTVFEMYKTVSLLAMPNLFQTTITDLQIAQKVPQCQQIPKMYLIWDPPSQPYC